jgi:hypothetical protein
MILLPIFVVMNICFWIAISRKIKSAFKAKHIKMIIRNKLIK